MISYAEEKNRKVTDWNWVLNNWNIFGDEGRREYVKRSQSWVTCACGNQCAKIPRGREVQDRPDDKKLASYGSSFYNRLLNNDIMAAKGILQQIEARSIELLKALD